MGDSIDYNQRARINIGELVMETLEVRTSDQRLPTLPPSRSDVCPWVSYIAQAVLFGLFCFR